MAYVQRKQDPNGRMVDLQTGPRPVAGAASALGGGAPTRDAPRGSGFVNIGRYLEANRGQGTAMGRPLVQGAQVAIDNAHQAIEESRQDALRGESKTLDPWAQNMTDAANTSVQTLANPVGALREKYGATSAGGAALDSALVRSENAPALGNLQGQWKGINDFLGYSQQQVANQGPVDNNIRTPATIEFGAPAKTAIKQAAAPVEDDSWSVWDALGFTNKSKRKNFGGGK